MPTRSISLTPEQGAFIAEVVEAGEYQNASEAIRSWRDFAFPCPLHCVRSPMIRRVRWLAISGSEEHAAAEE